MTREEVLNLAGQIAKEVVGPRAEETDQKGAWPEAGIRALQKEGLGGLVVPEELGGLGHGLHTLAMTCEILGKECPSTALCFGMHCVATAVLVVKAKKDQVDRFLTPICDGKHLTTLALSEPGTGAHFYFPQTKLEAASSSTFQVCGIKEFVTNGGRADSYIVSAVASEKNAPPGHFSCVVISNDTDGLIWGSPWQGIGMRGNSSIRLELRNAKVPKENLLGEEGDQIWYVFKVIAPYFLMAMAGTYLGIATTVSEEAQKHLMHRTHSHLGQKLSQVPLLQHRYGTIWRTIERARRLIYHAGFEADNQSHAAVPLLCSAKADVAECVTSVINNAMTLMGGIAYREGSKVERLFRDARAAHVMSPTTDLLEVWTGRSLLKESLLD